MIRGLKHFYNLCPWSLSYFLSDEGNFFEEINILANYTFLSIWSELKESQICMQTGS